MNAAEWLAMLAVAAVVLVASALMWTMRAERERLRTLASLQARVAAAKAELAEIDRRIGAAEIAPENGELDRQRIAASLLGSTAAAPLKSRPSPGYAGGALAVAVAAAGAVHLWSSRTGDRSEVLVAAAPRVTASAPAASGAAQDKVLRALSDEQLQRMVEEAGAQVKKSPGDAAAWAMLAHSYDMLGKFAESSKAYATLARLLPKDAQVLADYADALAVANGRTLAGEPTELVKRALALDPKNLKALALSGTAAYERSDFVQAATFWERALAASPDPVFRQQIEGSLLAARSASQGGSAGSAPVAAAKVASAGRAAPGASVVAGRVTLADDLVAKASPDSVVYIFARPAEGSRMPVALLRRHVRDLPVDFSLDDSSAMVPDVHLSQVQTVVIGARISRRGDVTPQPGDMQGWSAPLPVGTRGIRLEISEVLK